MNVTDASQAIDHRARIERVRAEMRHHSVDHLLVGPSTDLEYLLGYPARQTERLTLLSLAQEGRPHLVMPSFELPRVQHMEDLIEPEPWTEVQDPVKLVASLVPGAGRHATIAVGGQLYTHFLLQLQAAMPEARYLSGDVVLGPVRMRKSKEEIERLRAAARAADATWEEFADMPLLGVSEKEMLAHIHRILLDKGHDAIGGGIVGIGANGA